MATRSPAAFDASTYELWVPLLRGGHLVLAPPGHLDVGTMRKISDGAIKVAPGVSTVTRDGAVFQNGSRDTYDAIILATGYSPNYRNFLAEVDSNSADSIYFIGFRNVLTGLLRQISIEATAAAEDIRRRQQTQPSSSDVR